MHGNGETGGDDGNFIDCEIIVLFHLNYKDLYAMITVSIQVFLFLRRSPVLLWDVSKTLCLTITFLMHKSREFIRRCSLVQIIYMYRRIMDERKKKV